MSNYSKQSSDVTIYFANNVYSFTMNFANPAVNTELLAWKQAIMNYHSQIVVNSITLEACMPSLGTMGNTGCTVDNISPKDCACLAASCLVGAGVGTGVLIITNGLAAGWGQLVGAVGGFSAIGAANWAAQKAYDINVGRVRLIQH